MVNRILWSAAITLALTFSPNLALSVPTKTVKKKSSKPQEKVAKKSKSSKKFENESYPLVPVALPGGDGVVHGSQFYASGER